MDCLSPYEGTALFASSTGPAKRAPNGRRCLTPQTCCRQAKPLCVQAVDGRISLAVVCICLDPQIVLVTEQVCEVGLMSSAQTQMRHNFDQLAFLTSQIAGARLCLVARGMSQGPGCMQGTFSEVVVAILDMHACMHARSALRDNHACEIRGRTNATSHAQASSRPSWCCQCQAQSAHHALPGATDARASVGM